MELNKLITTVIGVVILMLASVELIPIFQNGSAELGLLDMPFAGLFGSSGIMVLAFVGALIVVFLSFVNLKKRK